MKLILFVVAILTLSACDLELAAITPEPPGTTAALDDCVQAIELTRGVAVGIDCRDAGRVRVDGQSSGGRAVQDTTKAILTRLAIESLSRIAYAAPCLGC
jgi:hypothetical protein